MILDSLSKVQSVCLPTRMKKEKKTFTDEKSTRAMRLAEHRMNGSVKTSSRSSLNFFFQA